MILFFDTETTGKADFRSEPDAPHQPRLVQFAALLCNERGETVSSVDLIVRPEGFTIPDSASSIHGITTEIATKNGVDCSVARSIYRRWWEASSVVVAHNIQFDLLIMDGELFRKAGGRKPWGEVRDTFCTMEAMTPICNIPGPYGPKWPKLQEAHKHAFGKEFDGAHDALADARACKDLYFWILSRQKKDASAALEKATV